MAPVSTVFIPRSDRPVILVVSLMVLTLGALLYPGHAVAEDTPPQPEQLGYETLRTLQQALEKALNNWPARANKPPPRTLQRHSQDLENRVRKLIDVLGDSREQWGEFSTQKRLDQILPELYYGLADVTRSAVDAQISAREEYQAAVEERRKRARQTEQRPSESPRKTKREKEDIDKVLDLLFGRKKRSEPEQDPEPEPRAEQPASTTPISPPLDYKPSLRIVRDLVQAITRETEFVMEVSGDTDTVSRQKRWIAHLEDHLGRYLAALHQADSLEPLHGLNYRSLLDGFHASIDDDRVKNADVLSLLYDSLQTQQRALSSIRYGQSPRSYELLRVVTALQEKVDRRRANRSQTGP